MHDLRYLSAMYFAILSAKLYAIQRAECFDS